MHVKKFLRNLVLYSSNDVPGTLILRSTYIYLLYFVFYRKDCAVYAHTRVVAHITVCSRRKHHSHLSHKTQQQEAAGDRRCVIDLSKTKLERDRLNAYQPVAYHGVC